MSALKRVNPDFDYHSRVLHRQCETPAERSALQSMKLIWFRAAVSFSKSHSCNRWILGPGDVIALQFTTD